MKVAITKALMKTVDSMRALTPVAMNTKDIMKVLMKVTAIVKNPMRVLMDTRNMTPITNPMTLDITKDVKGSGLMWILTLRP